MTYYGARNAGQDESGPEWNDLGLQADFALPSATATAAPSDFLSSPVLSGESIAFSSSTYPTTSSSSACEQCVSAGRQEGLHGANSFDADPWSTARDITGPFADPGTRLRLAREVPGADWSSGHHAGVPPGLQHNSSESSGSTVTPANLTAQTSGVNYTAVRSYSTKSWQPVNATKSISALDVPSTSWEGRHITSVATVDLGQTASSDDLELTGPSDPTSTSRRRRRPPPLKLEDDEDLLPLASPTSATEPRSPVAHRKERNRVAARKCREKTKQTVEELQKKERELASNNNALRAMAKGLRDEVLSLKHNILSHGSCDSDVIQRYINNQATKLRGEISVPAASTSASRSRSGGKAKREDKSER